MFQVDLEWIEEDRVHYTTDGYRAVFQLFEALRNFVGTDPGAVDMVWHRRRLAQVSAAAREILQSRRLFTFELLPPGISEPRGDC
ncbi:MAG: hypothetical protein RIQ60_2761 [Pseudomonadota bacterium]|jgi:hypothetical protein